MTSSSKLTTTATRKGKRSRPNNHNSNNNIATGATMAVPDPSAAAAASNNTVYSSSVESYLANANGTSVKRIRTPHPHDVLSGRGGGINSHPGNVTFRAWVATRKNDYNLALNKADKAAVAKQVVAMVKAQDPPGRFLTKDPTGGSGGMSGLGGWWVELDEERTMAKTAQALREGAPAIRAEHADELLEMKKEIVEHRKHRVKEHSKPHRSEEEEATSRRRNGNEEEIGDVIPPPGDSDVFEEAATTSYVALPPQKRVRVEYNGNVVRPTDATPPLLPSEPVLKLADLPPLEDHRIFPLPPTLPKRPSETGVDSLKRAHSLAFSEDTSLGEWVQDDFVNPFEGEDEMARLEAIRNAGSNISNSTGTGTGSFGISPPGRTGFSSSARDTSTTSSHGDMGGISALLHGNSGSSTTNNNNVNSGSSTGLGNHRSGSSSVRSRTSIGNMSSRYELDGFFNGDGGLGSPEDDTTVTTDDFRELFGGLDPLTMSFDEDDMDPHGKSSPQSSYLQWWELPIVPRPVSPNEA
jgi:hypothetical protein